MDDRTAALERDGEDQLTRTGALWLTGAGLSLIAVCYGLARFAYGLFVPVFRDEFTLDAATAGAIASGSYASYCVAIVISTILTPRFGGRALAVTAGFIATGGTLMIAAAPNTVVLAVGVIIAGSSTGVASPPLAHAVAHVVAAPRRNRMQTVINAGTGVGVAVAGPIALLSHQQWRFAWLAFAIGCALVTVWVALAVPAPLSPQSGRPHSRRSLTALLPSPLLPAGSGRLMAAAALMGAASAATWTFGRDLLVTVGDMSEQASTVVWILLGTFGMLGAAAGDLAGRFGIRMGWLMTMLVMAAATGLIAAFPGNIVLASIAAAGFGAAYIALTGLLLIWGTRVYSQEPATGVGLAFLVIALGQTAGAPITGALTVSASPQAAFAVAALLAAAGGIIRPRSTDPDGTA